MQLASQYSEQPAEDSVVVVVVVVVVVAVVSGCMWWCVGILMSFQTGQTGEMKFGINACLALTCTD